MPIQFHSLDSRPTGRYVSATTVYEEALEHTRLVGIYWSASGQVQRENVAVGLPDLDSRVMPIHTFDLEIDGQLLHDGWEWVGAMERQGKSGTREGVVELRHQVRPVTIKVVTRLDDTPFLVRYLEITNTGAAPAALARVSPWSGMLWNTRQNMGQMSADIPSPFTLGYMDADLCQGQEGNFVWEPLARGTRRISTTGGGRGHGNPFFIVRNEVTGECAIGSLAWSGDWAMEFWYDPYLDMERRPARGYNLRFSMGPTGPAPQRVIAPGESITTPEMHLAMLHGSFDTCIDAVHAHVRASVVPPRPKGKEFYTLAGRVVEERDEWILREIDIAAEMGCKAFMVDAGWYGEDFAGWWAQRGDWREGNWITGGLAACRELAHKHGMLFGMWMEPEALTEGCRTYKEHPEWEMVSGDGRKHPALDLAHPEAAKFHTHEVLRVIREHKLDFFKQDYNDQIYEGGQRMRDGFLEHCAWRHYETVYGTFDAVRREFPKVALENCSGGGGRNDWGMMARFHYACESDFSTFPRAIRAINGLTMFLPPEALCYYHNHLWWAHQQTDLDTHLRVSLFAQPIFVGFGAQDADRTTEYFQKTKRYIKLNNEFCGPIIANQPRVYHHTPFIGVQSPADWCVLEYGAQDKSRGYVGVFRLEAPVLGKEADTYLLRPRGIDPARNYVATLDNQNCKLEISGADLLREGLPIHIDGAYTSELVMYQEKA
jgi:alpha-galactosidase